MQLRKTVDGTAVAHGNAARSGREYREWFTGRFIPPEFGLRSAPVELKWSHRDEGWTRGWSGPAEGTSITILIEGSMALTFKGSGKHTVVLDDPGDYVMWGPGERHNCLALEDCTVLTVRWDDEI
jgi:hypothetical protein